jgi:hypothetical protein
MPNHAYMNVWCKDFPEELILERLGAFLGTVPFSARKPGFTYLTVRALDDSELPVLEVDLRPSPLDAAGIVEIAGEHLHNDCSYEVSCFWDLSSFDAATGKSKTEPQPLGITCRGEGYADGIWRESGHLEVDLGFEHFFTGHGGLLGVRQIRKAPPQSPEEIRFIEAMAWPENLEKYGDLTRENIRRVRDWATLLEKAAPIEMLRMWSEGEENFEARVQEIAAVR